MSKNKRIAQCKHKKHKNKLVSWAYNCRSEHEQGFNVRLCCAECGVILKNKK